MKREPLRWTEVAPGVLVSEEVSLKRPVLATLRAAARGFLRGLWGAR